MSWPDAMKQVRDGKKVARVEWGNSDYCFRKNNILSIFIGGKVNTWTKINDGDMDAQDWTVVNPAEQGEVQ